MDKELLQELIKLKFRLADQIIETLPEPVKQTLKTRETELLSVVGETARLLLAERENAGSAKDKPGMNSITIE
ncbi:hypothetical protein [Paenibacillus macerans]|uniref:hypothetical protein n=1 Tax=Paenibacillus macerans TaxID=44252 RepID=UPI003D318ABD